MRVLAFSGDGPVIDGKLTEPVWRRAPAATSFTQKQPVEGAPATERTEVRFLLGDDALYVGARMWSGAPIQAPMTRRDHGEQADLLIVSLDTYLNRRTAYSIGITAAGTRIDRYHPSDQEGSADDSWDPAWTGRATVDANGWTAELRIPITQLRFNPSGDMTWGLNIRRVIPSKNEEDYWVLVPRQEAGWASRFGRLTGLVGIRQTRRLEIVPYVSTTRTYPSDVDPEDPFHKRGASETRAGADLRVAVGPNLSFETTINPDFGQIEADPAVVNLTAFETFFPEKRPFFLERSDLLRGRGPVYFYSRRIGAPPRGTVSADFVDFPRTTSILGAAKLTGRLSSGQSIGLLAAVTGREHARTFDRDTQQFGEVGLTPLTGFVVMRGEQEVGSNSSAGVTFTAVTRDLNEGDPLASRLNRRALAFGGDWNLLFANSTYQVAGHFGASQIDGTAAAIERAQRSSARYYQRPDAVSIHFDPTLTTLSGYSAELQLAKISGEHWLWNAGANATSPGFEINDAGRLVRADIQGTFASLTFRETTPRAAFRDYSVSLSGDQSFNFDGIRTARSVRTDLYATWPNFWSSSFAVTTNLPALSDRLTRGGPLMGTGRSTTADLRLTSSATTSTSFSAGAFVSNSEFGERTLSVDAGLSMRPFKRLQISLAPTWYDSVDPRQYSATLDGGPAATFGQRYIFSTVDRTDIALRTRVNLALMPDLTLELYVDPFASKGTYSAPGELVAARSSDLRLYGGPGSSVEKSADGMFTVNDRGSVFTFGPLDFDIRSFRSNAVLRWEYRPGSILYLVWQQDRFGDELRGRNIGLASLGETFDQRGNTYVALKLTYRISGGGW